jgi:hypothetical protein
MPPRFSLNTNLTLGVNAPLVATTIWIGQKVVHFGLRYLMPRSRVEGYLPVSFVLTTLLQFLGIFKVAKRATLQTRNPLVLMTIRVFSFSNIFEASNGYP